jgi:hypothetical protein
LLTGKLDPFLKKNNAGEGAQTPPAGRTVVKPPSAVNPSAMTLSDRRRLTVNNA